MSWPTIKSGWRTGRRRRNISSRPWLGWRGEGLNELNRLNELNMKYALPGALALYMVGSIICLAETQLMEQANQLELKGQFKQAAGVLTAALQGKSLDATERKRVEFELDRLDRIKQDFPYTKEQLFTELKKSVKNLTANEYEQWVSEGRFDSREIDGQRYFMGSSESNLFFRYQELSARRLPPKD